MQEYPPGQPPQLTDPPHPSGIVPQVQSVHWFVAHTQALSTQLCVSTQPPHSSVPNCTAPDWPRNPPQPSRIVPHSAWTLPHVTPLEQTQVLFTQENELGFSHPPQFRSPPQPFGMVSHCIQLHCVTGCAVPPQVPAQSATAPAQLHFPAAIPLPPQTPHSSTAEEPPQVPAQSNTAPAQLHLPAATPLPPQTPHVSKAEEPPQAPVQSNTSPAQLHLPRGMPLPPHTPQTSSDVPEKMTPSHPAQVLLPPQTPQISTTVLLPGTPSQPTGSGSGSGSGIGSGGGGGGGEGGSGSGTTLAAQSHNPWLVHS